MMMLNMTLTWWRGKRKL